MDRECRGAEEESNANAVRASRRPMQTFGKKLKKNKTKNGRDKSREKKEKPSGGAAELSVGPL